ncbi:sodium:solute symporter family protein [Dysgonomonas sp. 520]|uniref:sodium:solute symporter family protein n=1 Tax=Dysgonomonas sp. 520 TaxID=2302931 RepID=UPI0013D0D340|nr:sodium:solute symporter family protein [Dysgonomonas sp. 520]NDW08716.1 sodium transporter [Dysgonomonas sp. 520]
MTILDLLTIILFSLGVVLVGLAFTRRGKNMKSFFAGGGAMPWQMSGLSLFMGFFSAGTFVVWGSVAYSQGWVAISIQWTMAIAGFIVGTFIAPRWHKTGALTAAEYITNRLGVPTQKVYTYLFLFLSIFLTASFLYPVAKILQVSTDLPLNACILLLGGLCVLYVSAGGLWAVVSTDVLQFVILTAAVIIVIPLSFQQIDGVTTLMKSAPDTFFNFLNGEYTLGFIVAFGIYNCIFLGGNWAYVQRYTCVKTQKDSKKVGWLFGCLYIISPILWMLPPMIYRICDSSLSPLDAEGAYLLMCKEVLPNGLLGLMIGGMIFATTSALNSKLNIASGVLTNDVFKRLRPNSSDKKLMSVARLSTILFGTITIIVAMLIPYMGGVVNVVISLAALTGVPMYLPVIWTLFSKRQTSFSNLSTTIFCLSLNGFFKFIAPLFGLSMNRTEEMVLGVSVPILCMLGFEIYYKYKNSVSDMYESYLVWENQNNKRQESTSKEQIQAEKGENKFSMKVIGYGIFFTGIAIALLGGIADTGKTLVITTGVVFALFGLFLVKRGKKKVN